jgi:hypothetical protein
VLQQEAHTPSGGYIWSGNDANSASISGSLGKSHWASGVLRDRRDPDPLRLGLRGSPAEILLAAYPGCGSPNRC